MTIVDVKSTILFMVRRCHAMGQLYFTARLPGARTNDLPETWAVGEE